MALSVIYIFSTLCGVKPIQIPVLNLITPPAIFIYPLTFILVDILNEFYGLRLAAHHHHLVYRQPDLCHGGSG